MTKPKTVRALLAEANKLARERGFRRSPISPIGGKLRIQSLLGLIAALREVPVRKRKR